MPGTYVHFGSSLFITIKLSEHEKSTTANTSDNSYHVNLMNIKHIPIHKMRSKQNNQKYFRCSAFFGVYSMAVDTLFLCFLEDLERNDGSEEKPYYMSR